MSDELTSNCPLCKQPSPKVINLYHPEDGLHHTVDVGFEFTCKLCGQFIVTESDLKYTLLRRDLEHVILKSGPVSDIDTFKLSALLSERRIQNSPAVWLRFEQDAAYGPLVDGGTGKPPVCVHVPVKELLSHWPHTVPEKLNRTLQNLAGLSPKGGDIVRLLESDLGVCFARSMSEMWYHINSLQEQGLLSLAEHTIEPKGSMVVLSAKGWARFDELTRGAGSPENPAFIAMWFGGKHHADEMDKLYKESIKPAAADAGYLEGRVDGEGFNDFIMDKVLGDIRLAPFVVADFTGNRGGVYLEAGFARGLGKPVIHTCKEEDFDEAHFDIKQINTIKWTKPGDLREKLYHRIMATLGPGPHKKRET